MNRGSHVLELYKKVINKSDWHTIGTWLMPWGISITSKYVVGHSLAGMIISGVAERIPELIEKLVFVAA